MASQFRRDLSEYERNIDIINGYMEQAQLYLQYMTGKDPETVKTWLKKEFSKGGRFEIKPPKVNITLRDPETGDRKASSTDMAKLLTVIDKKELIISPSMTVYLPPKIKKSLLSIFIDANIKARGKIKDEMFAAKSAGNFVLAQNKENEQNAKKTRNNGLSGAHSSPYTILYNKSTHSSLTSTCRSATSYGNANNEKMLSGTRHYWAPGIVINNILSTISLTDFNAFETCVEHYNLHIPTIDETMVCIRRSTDLFWINGIGMTRIKKLVSKIRPIERAAFVYIGDMYHLAMYNDELVRGMLTQFIEHPKGTIENEHEIEKSLDGDTIALVSLLRSDILGASNFKAVKEKSPKTYSTLMATCSHVLDTVNDYLLLIREVFTTRNVPASIAKLPDTIRRVSLVSDTDSTMGTAQWWAEWYCGKGKDIGVVADNVSDVVIYIAVQNISHMMARMSKNLGVDVDAVFRYAMKNEYKFASFAMTNKAKHYFALITSREGNLYEDPELEVKGVALRTSNIPPLIMNQFRKSIRQLSLDVAEGRNINILPFLKEIADIERSIVASVTSGEYDYLKTGQIKTKDGYTKPESSVYAYHEFWDFAWAPKYGISGPPPYDVINVSVKLPNKTSIKRWIDRMADRELAGRVRTWIDEKGRSDFTRFMLPEVILSATGIPKEILDITDYRRLIFSSVEPYYHVLESLGLIMIDDERTRLVSDYY